MQHAVRHQRRAGARRPAATVIATAALLAVLAPGAAFADDGWVPTDPTSTTSTDPTTTEPTTTDTQPDTTPADTQPADTQPADTQPTNTQSSNSQSPDTQPTTTQPTTTDPTSTNTQPDNTPVPSTPTDPTPGDTQPADDSANDSSNDSSDDSSDGDEGPTPTTGSDDATEGVDWFGHTITGLVGGRALVGSTLTWVPSAQQAGWPVSLYWSVPATGDSGFGTSFTVPASAAGRTINLAVTDLDSGTGWSGRVAEAAVQPTVTVEQRTFAADESVKIGLSVSYDAASLPEGFPVSDPYGTATITLTRQSDYHETVVYGPEAVVDGHLEAALGSQLPGVWDVRVDFEPFPWMAMFTPATATGTVTVTQAGGPVVTHPAELSAPSALDVLVAAPVKFTAQVTGTTIPAGWMLYEGSTRLGMGMVSYDGRVEVSVPALTPGVHDLSLVLPIGSSDALTASIRVTVAGEPVREGATPSADLASPHKATVPGQSMDLVAKGFQEGETVAFYLHSDPVFLGTAVADGTGTARLTAVIPADAPAGAHSVVATGGTSGLWATLAVTLGTATDEPTDDPTDESPAGTDDDTPAVTTPVSNPVSVTPAVTTAAATSPALAITGAQSGVLALGAALLLALGGGLVLTNRRLRTQR